MTNRTLHLFAIISLPTFLLDSAKVGQTICTALIQEELERHSLVRFCLLIVLDQKTEIQPAKMRIEHQPPNCS